MLLHFYETLTPDRVPDFGFYYAENAYFKDPFNEATRIEDIREIFARMFRVLADPHFVVHKKSAMGQTVSRAGHEFSPEVVEAAVSEGNSWCQPFAFRR